MEKKPMMWMGKVSAWAAVVTGALTLAFFAARTIHGIDWIAPFEWTSPVAGVLLLIGGYRTLRKLSGGLRLLAGAWGVATGISATTLMLPKPIISPPSAMYDAYIVVTPYGEAPQIAWLAFVITGLALAVLHKEK